MELLSNHDPGRKQEAVERDWLNTVFNRPATAHVQAEVFRAADE